MKRCMGWLVFCMAAVTWLAALMGGIAQAEGQGRAGIASWYSRAECMTPRNPNALTASGEPLDDKALTCATWGVPFGTRLRVSTLDGTRSVIVRVNDRGPARRLGRLIDLTRAAFSRLAPLDKGLVRVTVREVRS